MGYASAMAVLLLVVVVRGHAADRPQLAALGPLRGRARDERARPAVPAPPRPRRRLPAAVAAPALLIAVADHSLLIAAAIAFVAPFVFMLLTSLMTNDQALSPEALAEPFQWSNYTDVFDKAPMLRYALNTMLYSGLATIGRAALERAGRLRARAAALARARTPCSCSCWRR